jgi:hypothetical protein
MTERRPNAADAIYGHLRPAVPERPTPAHGVSGTTSLYPTPVPKPKPPSDPHRDALLRHLHEANAAADARLRRERGQR